MSTKIAIAAFAFALSASAAPPKWGGFGTWSHKGQDWPHHGGYGGEASSDVAVPTTIPSGIIPTGTAPVAPIATGIDVPVQAADSDDSDDEETSTYPTYSATDSADGVSPTDGAAATGAASSSGSETTAAPVSGDAPASGGDMPASSGTSVLSAVQTIAAGESFDGGMFSFDRGVSCSGQAEGGDSDAVFEIEDGGSLSNVIIGPNQIEGVHCYGACTLTNVWWSAVCEDAFTIKEQDAGATTKIVGGGAYGAEDKVLQHNGAGTLEVTGFTVANFGKLYRACGNCKESLERHVVLTDITATDGKSLVGINPNFGDTAILSNIQATGVKATCVTYEGTTPGNEPEEVDPPAGACTES